MDLFDDEKILAALMITDYYPRINFKEITEEESNAFMIVYNKLVEVCVERGILEC